MTGKAIKVNMILLVKDNLNRNMLSMRIKRKKSLNFLSEPLIKNGKRLQELKSY